ncbi:MAG: peptidoglycan-associated lipoprotein Pal [Paracoccaceae bacterium]
MNVVKSAVLALGVLALAACQNGGPFGNRGGAAGGANGANAANGGPIEESSLAYFNERIGDTIQFQVDQSTVTAQGQVVLDAQIAWLRQYPDRVILIEGHADEQGTREYNLALGARRAAAVRNYMVSQGILESRISVVSYGKERPLAVCSNEECWSRNRRAVTVVSGGMNS